MTAKRVEEGEVAVIGVLNQPGTVLVTVSDMSVVETEMEVDETSIPTVTVVWPALKAARQDPIEALRYE